MEQLNYQEHYNKIITSFLEGPEQPLEGDIGLLEHLLEKYPYSQPLHFINAANKKNSDTDNYVSKASVYAPHREILYSIVHQPEMFKDFPREMQAEAGANTTDANFLTGNALQPVTHLEIESVRPVAQENSTEFNQNIVLPEDMASDDRIIEGIIAGTPVNEILQPVHSGEAKAPMIEEEDVPQEEIAEIDNTEPVTEQKEAVEDEPQEEISEIGSEGIVTPEHNSFIEADERGLITEEAEENIATVIENSPDIEGYDEAAEDESEPDAQSADRLNRADEKGKELEEDKLIGSIAGSDFFAFEKSAVDPLQAEPDRPTIEKQASGSGNVSKYNDDKLPYTFLWWLNKTRKEHASTYQPYAFSLDTSQSIKQSAGAQELNQQIIENIFHLQTPLDDITLEAQPNTIQFQLKRKEDVIIEKFIKEEPQIKPPKPEKIDNENKARKSAEDPNDLVSETLARIYTDQMLYHKAIDTYKKLSLKFPEKSTYFASQIIELEKKSIN